MQTYHLSLLLRTKAQIIHYASIIILIYFSSVLQASGKSKINLDSLYRCLDKAIDSSSYYIDIRQKRIDYLTIELKQATIQQEKYRLSFDLYEEYRSFKSDSAVTFLDRCIDIASHLGDKKHENNCRALLAFQCSTTGMYAESFELIHSIDTSALDEEGRRNYLIAGHHLYSEMSYYTSVPWIKQKYSAESTRFLSQIFKELRPNDDEYLQRREMDYYYKNDFKNALRVNDQWMHLVERGSHRYAIAAFYRFLAYSKLNDEQSSQYWLLESALSDVRNAVTDQGSLWEIANRLNTDPNNVKRSYKYIRFAWQAAQTFNTRVRSNQISPVLSLIEGNYQEHITHNNIQLRIINSIVGVLLVVVAVLFFYANRQRHKLQMARNELDNSNHELKNLNNQLSEYITKLNSLNKKMASTNRSLDESNKMKELYIGRFLSLCSTYIDKTETLRRNIKKRVKTQDLSGLARLAESKTEEWDDFYRNFDSAFLKLFPNFVAEFNALLRPEERVEVSPNGSLGTSIRIFALIRLGIDDSSRIAEFLHYSVNTIYNYRAKVKNGAYGDREEFEKRVKEIGME